MQLLAVFCIPRFEAKWRICLQAPKQKEIKTTSIADLTILELSVKCPKLGLLGTSSPSFAITGDEIRSEDKGSPCDTLKMGIKQGIRVKLRPKYRMTS
jgi:hypothetical protein